MLRKPPPSQLGWGTKRSPKQFTECYARLYPFRSVETKAMLRVELLSQALEIGLKPWLDPPDRDNSIGIYQGVAEGPACVFVILVRGTVDRGLRESGTGNDRR